MNTLDKYVSLYSSKCDKNPLKVNLQQLLFGDRYRLPVERVRREPNLQRQQKLKLALPLFTVSGTFRHSDASSLVEPTNLICLDIDAKDNADVPDFDNLKQQLAKHPYVAYCGRSVRGSGYFCIIPISDHTKLAAHFRALQSDFDLLYGINLDSSCTDICRKRFVSFDNEPYVNLDAEVYTRMSESLEKRESASEDQCVCARTMEMSPIVDECVLEYVRIIEKHRIDITADRKEWLAIAFAFSNEYGEDGRVLFHAVSRFYPRYSARECDRTFDSALRRREQHLELGCTINSFFYIARKYKVDALADFDE